MKIIKILLSVLLLPFFAAAQFQETIGNTGNDVSTSMIRTSDGGYMLIGDTYSFGLTKSDVMLIKLNAAGAIQWSKSYGGTDYDHGYSIIQTKDNGYAVCGVSGSNSGRVSLVRLNASGVIQWSKYYSANTRQSASTLLQTPDGGFAMAGQVSTYGNGSWGYLIKTDSLGGLMWSKQVFNRAFYPEIRKMIVTKDGGFAVVGIFPSPSYYDIYFVKLSANGTFEWARSIGGSSTEYPAFLIQSSDEGYVFGGNSFSYSNPIQQDMFVVKMDKDGNQQWAKTIGSLTKSESGSSIVETPDKGFVILGITDSSANLYTSPFLVQLNKNGKIVHTKVLTVPASDQVNTISTLRPSGIAFTGTTGSLYTNTQDIYFATLDRFGNSCGSFTTLDYSKDTGTLVVQTVAVSNAPTSVSAGNEVAVDRLFTVNTICPVVPAVTTNNFSAADLMAVPAVISIYPNPAKQYINLSANNPAVKIFTGVIYNTNGSAVKQLKENFANPVNISDLPDGVYFVKLQTSAGEKQARFVKGN